MSGKQGKESLTARNFPGIPRGNLEFLLFTDIVNEWKGKEDLKIPVLSPFLSLPRDKNCFCLESRIKNKQEKS